MINVMLTFATLLLTAIRGWATFNPRGCSGFFYLFSFSLLLWTGLFFSRMHPSCGFQVTFLSFSWYLMLFLIVYPDFPFLKLIVFGCLVMWKSKTVRNSVFEIRNNHEVLMISQVPPSLCICLAWTSRIDPNSAWEEMKYIVNLALISLKLSGLLCQKASVDKGVSLLGVQSSLGLQATQCCIALSCAESPVLFPLFYGLYFPRLPHLVCFET